MNLRPRSFRRLAAAVLGLASAAAWSGLLSAPEHTTGLRYDAERRLTGAINADADRAVPGVYPATRFTWRDYGQLVLIEKGRLSRFPAASVAPWAWTGFTVERQTAFSYDARGCRLRCG